MKNELFLFNLEQGQRYECELATLLPGFVIYTGQAKRPGTQGGGRGHFGEEEIILPDLLQQLPRWSVYYEVKAKTEPAFFRLANTWIHGVDVAVFEHYQQAQLRTQIPVVIAVHEKHGPKGEDGAGWLGISLEMAKRLGRQGIGNGSGMFNWPRDAMTPLRAFYKDSESDTGWSPIQWQPDLFPET